MIKNKLTVSNLLPNKPIKYSPVSPLSIKGIGYLLCHPKIALKLLSYANFGYLKEIGWIKSFNLKKPVDYSENPIPWNTYSYIDFISQRLKKNMSIFEYGSGYSTLYYQKKVNFVASVEHDMGWYNKISLMISNNVKLCHEPLEGTTYENAPMKFKELFSIIIIDGEKRVECMNQAIKYLKDDGVIVLDDSHWNDFKAGVEFLKLNDFKEIPFFSIQPGFFSKNCTSIFYKENNCLDI